MPRHKNKQVMAPWGRRVRIDCAIVKLVRLLWKAGLATCFSCEDSQGEVEIGVDDAEDAAWVWVFAHLDEKPSGEQFTAWRQQLEKLQRAARDESAAQTLAWYRGHIDRLEQETCGEPLAARQRQLEWLRRELREYEQNGTAWQSPHFVYVPGGELSAGPDWRWRIHSQFIYCSFPCARLPRVEANCEAALRLIKR
jgi:hypothetical protein